MKQLPLEWAEELEQDTLLEIELPPEEIEAVVILMARALVAIVTASGEVNDEG